MNKRGIGSNWEKVAATFLAERGMRILEINFRNRSGEIDLIGRHGDFLVFVEVKYRKNHEMGYAVEAVNYRKQCQICKVADYYRISHGYDNSTAVRYDVVAIQGTEIIWIPNAFPHRYRGF